MSSGCSGAAAEEPLHVAGAFDVSGSKPEVPIPLLVLGGVLGFVGGTRVWFPSGHGMLGVRVASKLVISAKLHVIT